MTAHLILGRAMRSLDGLDDLAPGRRPPHRRLLATLTGMFSLRLLMGDH